MNTSGYKSGKEFLNIKMRSYPKALAKVNDLITMIGESRFTMDMAEWVWDFWNNASYESPVNEMSNNKRIIKKLKEDTAYQEFFKKAMKKFNISTPADLKDPAKKKEFFDYIDKNYSAKSES